MPLGTEVGLGPGLVVLDRDPAAPTEMGTTAPTFGPCVLWSNGRPSQQLLSSCQTSAHLAKQKKTNKVDAVCDNLSTELSLQRNAIFRCRICV